MEEEAGQVDQVRAEVAEIVSRKLSSLATKKDVPRLAASTKVFSTSQMKFLYLAKDKNLQKLLSCFGVLLAGEEKMAFLGAVAESSKLEDWSAMDAVLGTLPEDSIVVRALKAMNQNCIAPPCIAIKMLLRDELCTSDDGWSVNIKFCKNGSVSIFHIRKERSVAKPLLFGFEWTLVVNVPADAGKKPKVGFSVTQVRFEDVCSQKLRKKLMDKLAPFVDQKNKVLLHLEYLQKQGESADLSSLALEELDASCVDYIAETKRDTLLLNYNLLNRLPESFGTLVLTELWLVSNRFEEIDPAIGNIKNLRLLHLGKNSISGGFEVLRGLKELRKLYLSYNKIEKARDVAECCCDMEHLQVLTLSNNFIDDFPVEEFRKLKALEKLELHNNAFWFDKNIIDLQCDAGGLDQGKAQEIVMDIVFGKGK